MSATVSKPLIFVVMLFSAGSLVYTSYSGFEAFAEPKDPNWGENCTFDDIALNVTCCWTEPDLYNPGATVTWCQTCDGDGTSCGPLSSKLTRPEGIPPGGGVLHPGDSSSTPPPTGPFGPLQGGVLQQTPSEGKQLQPSTIGEGALLEEPPADQGTTELPPATEGSQPATAEEKQPVVPVCQEGLEFNENLGFCVPTDCPQGQELNEETGICLLEEQPAAADQPEEQEEQTEDEQPSGELGSVEENGNN